MTKIYTMKLLYIFLFTFLPFSLYAHGVSESDKHGMISGGLLDYIWLGAKHMVTGYDHLLFLFGVIFFLTKFKDIVKFITAFTIGHSITLIFATFMEITANYYLIDAVIALTVIYKGFDNLDGFQKVFKKNSPNLVKLVFGFGLIHGFGLSARLQQLPLGDDGLLLKIISFNVGVELGQIVALGIMMKALSIWRHTESFKKFSVASNVLLILVGLMLFGLQMYGYFTGPLDESPASSQVPEEVVIESVMKPTSSGNVQVKQDVVSLTIPAGKSMEYKFFLQKGKSLSYDWSVDQGELYFDFHGDPQRGGKFQSYGKATKSSSKGTQEVPFDGSHGWYWKNKTNKDIRLILKTSGDYKVIGVK